jgi:hypothetical protein
MSIFAGPKIVDEGLIFSIDAANKKFISPLGNNSFNGAAEVIRSSIPGITVNSFNGVNLGNLNYYTVFAIDYPENAYGGDAANRHGMTPGLNVRSGTKLYDSSRALHMWVWNNDTNSWLSSSYFNGYRLSGHSYDNYSSAQDGYLNQINKFITDYNNINNIFKNCTFILTGSHKANRYTSGLRTILYDLGMPTGTALDSDTPSAPEWILVGKPGLGAGNAYGWSFQNYTTNAAQVAHLNFGLPIFGNKDNYLKFDGIDDYVNGGNPSIATGKITVNAWVKINAGSLYQHIVDSSSNSWHLAILNNNRPYFWNGSTYHTNATPLNVGQWYMLTGVQGATLDIYINGILSQSISTNVNVTTNNINLGRYQSGGRQLNGNIAHVSIYNRVLTTQEIKQNFEATRGRYGI